MSAAVICDECGRIVKRLDALHCAESKTHENGLVYRWRKALQDEGGAK